MPYERVLDYRHGVLERTLGPGRHRVSGFGHELVRVDLRASAIVVGAQSVPSSDGVAVKASAAVTWCVSDPRLWIETSRDPHGALDMAARVAVRDVVAARTVDELASGLSQIETPARLIAVAEEIGVTVIAFVVRDVILPAGIRRTREALVETRAQALLALEEARSQTAVLRHLANVAGVLDDHPALASWKLAETTAEHGGTVVLERPRS